MSRLKLTLFIISIFVISSTKAQISDKKIAFAKEFSKEIALYKAKQFVITNVFGDSKEVVKFQIDPLAASSSGELTSLVYRCDDNKKEGMVLGFYGSYWNSSGVLYTGYAFKNLAKEKGIALLQQIEQIIDNNSKYLNKDSDNNNLYFVFDDLTFLIYTSGNIKIRVFYNEFDSEWDIVAFRRTKRRLLNKLD